MPEHLPPPPPPWTPPQSPLEGLGDARVVALKVAGAVFLVVAVGIGLLVYGNSQDDGDLAELRELAAGGGAASLAEDETPASLWVNANPIGAVVLIDGDSAGTTPLWVDTVPAGERWIQIIGPAGVVVDTTLAVAGGSMAELDLTLSRSPTAADPVEAAEAPPPAPERPAPSAPASTGDLRVTSSPSGAVVMLDGRRLGTTPLSIDGVQTGRHSISVARGGYETVVRQVEVRPGAQLDAAIELRPVERAAPPPRPAEPAPPPSEPEVAATGAVEVLVRPWGRIVIDGTTHQRETDVVYRTTLPAGTHQIVVSHPQLGSAERTIVVQPGGVSRIEFDLASGADG